MSEFWIRFFKISALIVGACLVLFLIELTGAGPVNEIERYARDHRLLIESHTVYEISGTEVAVYSLAAGETRILGTVVQTVGYQSRFRVVVFYPGDQQDPLLLVSGHSESAMVERVLESTPVSVPQVLDALSGATVTANAIDRSLIRSDAAVRRFREEFP